MLNILSSYLYMFSVGETETQRKEKERGRGDTRTDKSPGALPPLVCHRVAGDSLIAFGGFRLLTIIGENCSQQVPLFGFRSQCLAVGCSRFGM